MLSASRNLLHFDGCASVCELLLNGLSFFLRDAVFHGFRRAIHQVLGFFQAQAGDFTYRFDYIDFVGSSTGQNDGELGLFLSRGRARCRSAAGADAG